MEIISTLSIQVNKQDFVLEKRIQLLQAIAKTGSISQAAKAVPMSYKTAWDAIDLMNNLSVQPLVETIVGGKKGGGTQLTVYGHQLVEAYLSMKQINQKLNHLLSQEVDLDTGHFTDLQRLTMQISARNVFIGTIVQLQKNEVNAEVILELNNGQKMVSVITRGAAQNLELHQGKQVKAIVKSSDVMILSPTTAPLSARNRLRGSIKSIQQDGINAELRIDLGNNQILTSTITQGAVADLKLTEGLEVEGVIKASAVLLGL